MKRTIFLSIVAVFVLIGTASAQESKANPNPNTSTIRKSCYIDDNKNGKCDNFENKTCTIGNGYGLMDGSGRGQALRNERSSQNKENQSLKQNSRGNNKKFSRNGEKRRNFVDANNNGVCDHRETKK